jgi:hypothetical protein
MALCSLMGGYQQYPEGGDYQEYPEGGDRLSKTLIITYKTTYCLYPEDHYPLLHYFCIEAFYT